MILHAAKPVNQNPIGYVDGVEGGEGAIHIWGWTFDPDDSSTSIDVHVYIGGPAGLGEGHIAGVTNEYREDVNNAYGISGVHGFDTWINTDLRGSQAVYIYAINTPTGDNPCLKTSVGSRESNTVTIGDLPQKVNPKAWFEKDSISAKVGETVNIKFSFTRQGVCRVIISTDFGMATPSNSQVNWGNDICTGSFDIRILKEGNQGAYVNLYDENDNLLLMEALAVKGVAAKPTATPTTRPTATPTTNPTATPTTRPTATPTTKPTATPTTKPTATPTTKPTATPTTKPTATPTTKPTATPTTKPTATPTIRPMVTPTATPTVTPTAKPTATPIAVPTATPTAALTPNPITLPIITNQPTPSFSSDNVDDFWEIDDDTDEDDIDEEDDLIGTEFVYDGISYVITDDDEVSVEGYSDKKTSITIPAYVKYGGNKYEVVNIGDSAFKENRTVTKITIKANLFSIGKNAFSGCSSLKYVYINSYIDSIKDKAFYKCKSLKKVVIKSEWLESVGKKAFSSISKKAVIYVPSDKYKEYKKMISKTGLPSKATIKKIS